MKAEIPYGCYWTTPFARWQGAFANLRGPGGTGEHEDWVMDNFGCDPLGPHAMLKTAENVAAKHRISTAEQHEVVLLRENQYREAIGSFHKRFMSLPFEVSKTTLEGDEGIRFSTAEGLTKLKPVLEGGTVTY